MGCIYSCHSRHYMCKRTCNLECCYNDRKIVSAEMKPLTPRSSIESDYTPCVGESAVQVLSASVRSFSAPNARVNVSEIQPLRTFVNICYESPPFERSSTVGTPCTPRTPRVDIDRNTVTLYVQDNDPLYFNYEPVRRQSL